jgi:hypothetical protein
MTIQIWINDPTILLNKDHIMEFWPMENMCYEQKLNAITRLVILVTTLGFILTMSLRIIFIGIVTIVAIYILYIMKKPNMLKDNIKLKDKNKEGFSILGNQVTGLFDKSKTITNPVTLDTIIKTEFKEGDKKNPFSNVLLTEIMDEPNRKSAPPAFNPDIEEDITKYVKKSVQSMNPGINNTNKQLYSSLWDNFELDQSNRVFFSTPNTKVVPGDQAAFGQYLYGEMPSAKESTIEGNLQREKDNYRYILY